MELVLTQADIDGMPRTLREQLFDYLGGTWSETEYHPAEAAVLTPEQATALLREVSFHHAGAHLRILLERFAYLDTARPPSRERLIKALGTEGKYLGRYLGVLNRLTATITGHPGEKLYEYQKESDTYVVPAATRETLRDLMTTMKASGKAEEPLWE